MSKPVEHVDEVPLCVDLDGTLILIDTAVDGWFEVLGHKPLVALTLAWQAWKQRAAAKKGIAQRAPIDPAHLPYRADLIDWLRQQKAADRRLVLVTGSDEHNAVAVARHLGLFDKVVASDGVINMTSVRKRDALIQLYGEGGFDYVGDSRADFAVWDAARKAYRAGDVFLISCKTKFEKHFRDSSPSIGQVGDLFCLRKQAINFFLLLPLVLVSERVLSFELIGTFFIFFFLTLAGVWLVDLMRLADRRKQRCHARDALVVGTVGWRELIFSVVIALLASCVLMAWAPIMAVCIALVCLPVGILAELRSGARQTGWIILGIALRLLLGWHLVNHGLTL